MKYVVSLLILFSAALCLRASVFELPPLGDPDFSDHEINKCIHSCKITRRGIFPAGSYSDSAGRIVYSREGIVIILR